MMLSIQAARMGSVTTSLRRIGCTGSRWNSNLAPTTLRSTSVSNIMRKDDDNTTLNKKLNKLQRNKSSAAYALDEHDDDNYAGLAAAAMEKAMQRTLDDAGKSSQKEAWMVNLGRKDNNAWLTGPRDEKEWFTGVPPSECPGKLLRSLPKPDSGEIEL